jgi:hypothetical protein
MTWLILGALFFGALSAFRRPQHYHHYQQGEDGNFYECGDYDCSENYDCGSDYDCGGYDGGGE